MDCCLHANVFSRKNQGTKVSSYSEQTFGSGINIRVVQKLLGYIHQQYVFWVGCFNVVVNAVLCVN